MQPPHVRRVLLHGGAARVRDAHRPEQHLLALASRRLHETQQERVLRGRLRGLRDARGIHERAELTAHVDRGATERRLQRAGRMELVGHEVALVGAGEAHEPGVGAHHRGLLLGRERGRLHAYRIEQRGTGLVDLQPITAPGAGHRVADERDGQHDPDAHQRDEPRREQRAARLPLASTDARLDPRGERGIHARGGEERRHRRSALPGLRLRLKRIAVDEREQLIARHAEPRRGVRGQRRARDAGVNW